MGSGSKRKKNDVVRINRPQSTGGTSGTGSGGSGGGSARDINKVCPPVFEVLISAKGKIPTGTGVVVKGGSLIVLGEVVGKLSETHLQTLTNCAGNGIHYTVTVVNRDNGKAYAHFEQSAI